MPLRKEVLILLCPVLLSTGCFVFRTKSPAKDQPQMPEFRGASAQTGQTPTIAPPPMPKLDSVNPDESPLQRLAARASNSERQLNAYYVRIRRHEDIDGKDQPEEIILFKFRRAPLSVHCKWL